MTCGLNPKFTGKNRAPVDRITGGVVAQKHHWPFLAFLRFSERVYCGGTILSDNWILTAAHCCYNKAADVPNQQTKNLFSKVEVRVGNTNGNTNYTIQQHAAYYIIRYNTHCSLCDSVGGII